MASTHLQPMMHVSNVTSLPGAWRWLNAFEFPQWALPNECDFSTDAMWK